MSSTVTLPLPLPPCRPAAIPPVATPVGSVLLDERFGDGAGNFRDFLTGDKAGHIDNVSIQIAMGARTRQFLLEPPQIGHRFISPIL